MLKYKRVLLKLSGETLSGGNTGKFDEASTLNVARQVKSAVEQGLQVGIVIGGGNFWRGRSSERMDRSKADEIGMMATVMNCQYAAAVFRMVGLDSVIMTPFPVGTFTEVYSKEAMISYLNAGKIVFFAGGTGHPYFSTDTGAALRALQMEADAILLAKNIDGVYDKDPNQYPDAIRFEKMTLSDVIAKGLKVMDMTAAQLCLENKMPMEVFFFGEENAILAAAEGRQKGTSILAE
ncbi:UMP kinase [Clostridiales bacterium COT073_COT-073]|nr:UMP kinase [Clostridiales bacterium COT073_COT-073]